MIFNDISSFVLGTFFLLVSYSSGAKAEVNVQPCSDKFGENQYSLAACVELVNADLSPVNSVESATLEPKIFKRAGKRWTTAEKELLIELRDQGMSWGEMIEFFPERSWTAMEAMYHSLKGRGSSAKSAKSKQWTLKEEKLLLELSETDASLMEIAKYFPERTPVSVKNKIYKSLVMDSAPANSYKHYTAEEDALLLELENEDVPWAERVPFFKDRPLESLKYRYRFLVSPKFTAGEDDLLLELEKEDVPWVERVTFFNNRTLDVLQERFKDLKFAGRRYTAEEIDSIIEANELGMTVEEIAQLIDKDTRSVGRQIRILRKGNRLRLGPIAKGRWYTDADFELMDEMNEAGISWKDIVAERFPGRDLRAMQRAYKRYLARNQKEEE